MSMEPETEAKRMHVRDIARGQGVADAILSRIELPGFPGCVPVHAAR
jgi:hypothetical protein